MVNAEAEAMIAKLAPVEANPPMIDAMETGARVARIRAAIGISQKELAAAMTISQSHMCQLEHGDKPWSWDRFASAKAALQNIAFLKSQLEVLK